MEIRPFLKPDFTTADKILEFCGWLALALLWVIFLYAISTFPETIPMQFDGSGNVTRYGDKMEIIFLPVLATMILIVLTVINRVPQHFNYPVRITPSNALRQYTNAIRMIRTLKIIIGIFCSVAMVMISQAASGQKGEVSMWFIPLMIGILFIPMGYFILVAIRSK